MQGLRRNWIASSLTKEDHEVIEKHQARIRYISKVTDHSGMVYLVVYLPRQIDEVLAKYIDTTAYLRGESPLEKLTFIDISVLGINLTSEWKFVPLPHPDTRSLCFRRTAHQEHVAQAMRMAARRAVKDLPERTAAPVNA